ncbi:OmpA family protein [Marinilabilia salmonicolor]|uniref:Outer membrane protein OmpA-like peptidoglycan-associated protein n=1 Tax=Marinilabilia salmonicolor TaxID=989 RepID=A0A368V6X8_9BACT|nr:OmpA family protein [Marinilabilia salmonicolor]RCW36852.1 outer membrane protein OmpA-like peptidoglycan-associated protein [Marinilabilia salmonicolor]
MQLKNICFLTLLLFSIGANAQLFGPKRSNLNMELSDWKIFPGDTVTITWDVTINRKQLKVTLNDSVVDRSGSLQLVPDTTVFYRLTAETAKGKRVNRTKKIKVLPPLINRLSMSDSTRFGHQDEVRWMTENVEKVTFNGDEVPLSGDSVISIMHDQPVTIRAINKNGRFETRTETIHAWYTHRFDASGLPPKDTLIVFGGKEVKLNWELDDASNAKLNGKTVRLKGFQTDTIRKDTTFVLQSILHDGSEWEKSITFLKNTVGVQHLSISNIFNKSVPFTFYNEAIRKYNPYKLQWNVSGVNSVKIKETHRPSSGILADQAMEEKDYTISWSYYDAMGRIREDSTSISLALQQRPLFNGNIRTETLLESDTIFMEIISVNYDNYPPETELKVIAIDGQGNFVKGLADDKQIKEDNPFHTVIKKYEDKTYPVRNFSVKEYEIGETEYRPQHLMMVLDYSGSMEYSMPELEPLIHKLIKEKHPMDTIRFVKFDETITAVSPPSANPDSLLSYFNQKGMEELSGYTALYAATDSAMNAMHTNNPNQRIILFTDGYENASFIYKNHLNTSAVEIIRRANEISLPIHVVSLGGYVNEQVLKYVADYTGAHYYQMNDVESVSEALREIFKTNLHYYTINYETSNNYEREKTITLEYDGKATGINYSTKNAAKKPNLRKISQQDLPPLPADVELLLQKENLVPLTGPQNMINFRFDKHHIREECTHDITQYLQVLQEEPETKAIIMGHTDMTGDPEYCITLSRKRAEAAAQKLIDAGIRSDRLFILGMGQKHPLWPDDSEPAKAAENRRVEILFVE